MKYSLKKGQQQEDVLVINGIDSVCPFVSGIPVQSEQHGFQILRVPCTSQCPHVSVSINDDNSVKYSISCTDTKTFDIEIETKKESPLTILKPIPIIPNE